MKADDLPRSSLPLHVLEAMQRGIMSHAYKDIDCYKCPMDLAIYQRLMWELKPRTVIEIGTAKGGSALWLADQLSIYGVEGFEVHSLRHRRRRRRGVTIAFDFIRAMPSICRRECQQRGLPSGRARCSSSRTQRTPQA